MRMSAGAPVARYSSRPEGSIAMPSTAVVVYPARRGSANQRCARPPPGGTRQITGALASET